MCQGGAHILRYTGMCHGNGVSFSQEIFRHGSYFCQKMLRSGSYFMKLTKFKKKK